MRTVDVHLPRPHAVQEQMIGASAKRIVVCGGRRGGKTVGAAIMSVKRFLAGQRVLYGAPTQEQVSAYWYEVVNALRDPIEEGILRKNEVEHAISLVGTKQQIKAKTCWNAETLRGDYADMLILDEWQLSNEDAWNLVGAPMLLDNNGDAMFIYTPPSMATRSISRAQDPRHASKLFKKALAKMELGDTRWLAIHFSSHANPHISAEALSMLTEDMTALAIRQEIEAEDIDQAPGALWNRELIERTKVYDVPSPENLARIVVAVDPPADSTAAGSGAGIMIGGIDYAGNSYLLADKSKDNVKPAEWGRIAVDAYLEYRADIMIGEVNNGGEMVEHVVLTTDPNVNYKSVYASRGKALRAEPVSARSEKGQIHLVGDYPPLEDEMCMWMPGDKSPHRLDAFVWLFTELLLTSNFKTWSEPYA